jgi:hypothetical protein
MSGLENCFRERGLLAVVTAVAATVTAVAATAAAITAVATAAAATAAEAATTTATPAEAAATAAAAETTAAARRTLLARARDVHGEGTTLHLVAVEFLDGLLGLFTAAHRDERKAAGAAGKLVENDFDDADGADLAEQGFKILRGAGEGEIPHVELGVV